MIRALMLIFLLAGHAHATVMRPAKKSRQPAGSGVSANWAFVAKRLKAAGFKPRFIQTLHSTYETAEFQQVLELNTLLFLRKTDYHGPQVDQAAVEDVRKFVAANASSLTSARKRYGVPGEVVASLMWIESRHGKAEGNFHVPSVFLDLIQADRPEVQRHLHTAALHYTPRITAKVKKDIDVRTHKRVAWAIGELKALDKMQKRDKNVVKELRGSFAGAFGMPQFIPSSYVHYAHAAKKGSVADLEVAADAAHSVAFYLHQSGWREGKQNSYIKALMQYNNSHDYAAAILNLADQAAPGSKRTPASKFTVRKRIKTQKAKR